MHSCNSILNAIGVFKRVCIFFLFIVYTLPTLAQSPGEIFAESETYSPDKQTSPITESFTRLQFPIYSAKLPTVILNPLAAGEKQAPQADDPVKPLAIGVGRTSAFDEVFDSSLLNWITVAGGRQAAAFTVSSPEAEAMRLKFIFESIPFDTELRFFNPQTSEITSSVKQQELSGIPTKSYWSPTAEGDAIGVEIIIPAGASPDELQFSVPLLSHLFVSPKQFFIKNLNQIGNSGSCNNDVACEVGISKTLIDSVAKYIISDQFGGSFLCTGTLLADTDTTTFIPYFFTANHCIDDSSKAASMEFYWFFQRASCGGPNPMTVTRQTGGATLLSTGTGTDHTLVQLNSNPPAGVGLSGWTNASIEESSGGVLSIHHPQGDLKKISFGSAQGFAPFLGEVDGNGSFIYTQWFDGTTEPGSSGAGLWAEFDNSLFLVGSLFGGFASCNAQNAPDYYGRFDLTFPSVASWLNPPRNEFTNVWWDPSRNGQGIQIVQNGNQLSGAWYLYDEIGDGMWVTFVGDLNGSQASASLLRFTGPSLGTVWNNNLVDDSVVGQVTINFSSAQSATFSYTLNGVSDTLNLQPFNPGAKGIFTRVWWDPSQSGQGVQILHAGNDISGAWYLYDSNGDGMWVTFTGTLTGNTVTASLLRFNGPALGTPWNNGQISNAIAGTVTLQFLSSTTATMSYIINGVSGLLNLQPFSP